MSDGIKAIQDLQSNINELSCILSTMKMNNEISLNRWTALYIEKFGKSPD